MTTTQLSRKHAISQARLKEVLHYDPKTGIFTNRIARAHAPVGSVAGWVHVSGYRYVCVDGVSVKAHQAAWMYMTGEWPTETVDHRDNDKGNNRWANLRTATNTENCRNVTHNCRNKSGVRGVLYRERPGRSPEWWASIRVDRRLIHLGIFRSLKAAAEARREAECRYFGEFAPNMPDAFANAN